VFRKRSELGAPILEKIENLQLEIKDKEVSSNSGETRREEDARIVVVEASEVDELKDSVKLRGMVMLKCKCLEIIL
jgi:hypothetical protein